MLLNAIEKSTSIQFAGGRSTGEPLGRLPFQQARQRRMTCGTTSNAERPCMGLLSRSPCRNSQTTPYSLTTLHYCACKGHGEKEFVFSPFLCWFQLGEETNDDNMASSLREVGQDPKRVLELAEREDIKRLREPETSRVGFGLCPARPRLRPLQPGNAARTVPRTE